MAQLIVVYFQCILIMLKFNHCLSSVSAEQKKTFLQMHNDVRNKILNCQLKGQPVAAEMPPLKWNDDLARKAQEWANQCRRGHDDRTRRVVAPFSTVGQNWAGTQTVERGVNLWIDEYKDYNYNTSGCTSVCGHYTQIVWAKTTDVGCGVKDCSSFSGYPYGLSIVCNYGPAGNWIGEKPYQYGDQSKCNVKGASTIRKPTFMIVIILMAISAT